MIRSRRQSAGYVLLLLVVALGLGASIAASALLSRLNAEAHAHQRTLTTRALNEAKKALIYRALLNPETPGGLPCGSSGLDGFAEPNCNAATVQAPTRFPFKSLALPPPKDDSSECLWYALSPDYRSGITADSRSDTKTNQHPLNPDNPGSLLFRQSADTPYTQVIAVIISPGLAQGSQARGSEAAGCHSGSSDNFLESPDASLGSFTVSGSSASNPSNDTVVTISRKDLMRPILRLVLAQFASSGQSSAKGLRWWLGSSRLGSTNDLVTTASLSGQQIAPTRMDREKFTDVISTDPISPFRTLDQFDEQFGAAKTDFIPPPGGGTTCNGVVGNKNDYSNPTSWLCFNNWYRYVEYVPIADSPDRKAKLILKLDRSDPHTYQCSLSVSTGDTGKADRIVCGYAS